MSAEIRCCFRPVFFTRAQGSTNNRANVCSMEGSKICPLCKIDLPLDRFPVRSENNPRPNAYCFECQRKYCRAHYLKNRALHNRRRYINQTRYSRENRERLLRYLRCRSCVDCGESDPVVLDFDHVRGSKEFNIGNAITQRSWGRIEREMQKCEIRCANCDRRKTARENQCSNRASGRSSAW